MIHKQKILTLTMKGIMRTHWMTTSTILFNIAMKKIVKINRMEALQMNNYQEIEQAVIDLNEGKFGYLED